MNQANTLATLDTLLDSDFSNLLPEIALHSEAIESVLHENEQLKKQVLQNFNTNESVARQLQKKILDIEKTLSTSLPAEHLMKLETLEQAVIEALSFLHNETEEGVFVTEAALSNIIDKHPPKNLLMLPKPTLDNLSTLERVSLSRHTEPKDWQKEYLEMVSQLSPDDFESRPVHYAVFDTELVKDTSSMKQKPWRISHTKETGYINIFTQDSESISRGAPVIQFYLVLFHYYFENLLSSTIAKNHKDSEKIGIELRKVIKSGRDKFPFFHRNCYSEHVYWLNGVRSVNEFFKDVDFSLFLDTMTCGGYIDSADTNSELIAFNLIDQVWNLNNTDATNYFEFSSDSFFYHFREGLWYDIMAKISGNTPASMEEFIVSNLSSGDQTLTKMLLAKS